MRLPGPGIWGRRANKQRPLPRSCARALELGINLIDTADSYGPEVAESLDCRGALSLSTADW